MAFEFSATGENGLMAHIAALTGSTIIDGMLILPSVLGKGYIKRIDLGPAMNMMIHDYELKAGVNFKRPGMKTAKEAVTFSFRNVFNQNNHFKEFLYSGRHPQLLPSVQVTPANVDFEIFAPKGTQVTNIIISLHLELLRELFNQKAGDSLFELIMLENKVFLYEEIISPQIQGIAAELVSANVPEILSNFYFKLKAEELIFLFFTDFLKRRHTPSYPLNVTDVKMIYLIKDKVISDLSVTPNLSDLAEISGMSESKMQRLFKQIFGKSIYNYYQMLRMNEAAYLIKEQKVSVSEAGYRMGFTNLSHFTRIFEKHIGYKPKKFSASNLF